MDYLDGWRGLAIVLVLQAHFVPLRFFAYSGRLGVDVFFCLSGLLISQLLFVQRVPLSTFYRRRVSRILPVFIVYVLVVYAGAYLAGDPYPWSQFVYTMTFLRTYLPQGVSIIGSGIPISHLWSLNVEEHCYVAMSALTLVTVMRGRAALVLIGTGLLSMVTYIVYRRMPHFAPTDWDLHTEVMASHILLSAGYRLVRDRVAPWVQPWMPIVAFSLAAVCYLNGASARSFNLLSPFLLAFSVNHLGAVPKLIRRMLAFRPLRLMGLWSYSIYLWQQPFFNYRSEVPGGPTVACIAAILVALLSFYMLENPVRSWLNSRWT